MCFTLAGLHEVLNTAYENGKYISYDKNAEKLYVSQEKEINLQQVFQFAQQEVAKALTAQNGETLKDRAKFLILLRRDANSYEFKYRGKISTLSRIWLRNLIYFTPNFLKIYLPSCFSNLCDTEKANIEEFENFRKFVDKELDCIQVSGLSCFHYNLRDIEKANIEEFEKF